MQQEEAIKLVLSEYPNHDVGQVTETDEYFVISILPKNNNAGTSETDYENIDLPLYDDGLKAVNKDTKSVFTYNPIKHGD